MIQSPLNYTGGKYRLLPQLLPLFPDRIGTFVDLFCGGCNVGINVDAERFVYNDGSEQLLALYDVLLRLGKDEVFAALDRIIDAYGLSRSSENGYARYGCESGAGLAGYNRPRYQRLRDDFNAHSVRDDEYYLMLYVLIVYAFNNQLRFNRAGEFNLPVGKRDFNGRMRRKLSDFLDALRAQDCRFTCGDFRAFDVSALGGGDLVYADPPYLITCATYNERGGWGESDERDLLSFLDGLSARGVRFALSNVLRGKGLENAILLEWARRNEGLYRTVPLRYSYANASYHTKGRDSAFEEVLIVNY